MTMELTSQVVNLDWLSRLWGAELAEGGLEGFMGNQFGPMTEREAVLFEAGFLIGAARAARKLGCETD